ncbi:MAG: DUF6541 family protein [Roseiflexaceae bacterium]
MRLDKSATASTRTLRLDWWPPLLLAMVMLAAWLFGDGQPLLWASTAVFGALLIVIAMLAMFLLPGLALLRLLWPDTLASAERWPLAIGISCSLPPLLLLLGEPLGLRWNAWLCWGFLVLCAIVLVWPSRSESWLSSWRRRLSWHPDRQHLLLLAITAAAVIARLYAARDLPVGMWGDSYHHTVIAQLLVDHGGLFSSWRPYAPLKTFTYHYGFHSNVAWLHWLSGEPVTRGLLVVGQLQSALAVPLVYLLTQRLLGRPRAALWAALMVGFVSIMPAFYLNWGRYTQLAGQTILPAACVVWMALLAAAADRSARRGQLLRLAALAALATAGLTLTHYRVAVFLACFIASYCLYLLLSKWRTPLALLRPAGLGLGAGTLAVLLALPWLLRLREGALLRIGDKFLSTNIGADQSNDLPPITLIFSFFANNYLLSIALIGVILLIWRRQWRSLVLVGWAALTWLAANPYLIGLNGAGIITSFAVLIAVYLVLAPLAGAAIDSVCEWLAHTPHMARLLDRGQVLAGVLLVFWGLGWQQHVIAPENQIFTPADQQAMDWIRQATPPDAAFFVNSFTAYGGTLYVGSDGGWWLPFMSGRQSSLPPITYASEASEQPGFQGTVNTINATIERDAVHTHATAAALRAAGYTYLYDGPAAAGLPPGTQEYIDPADLAGSPLYELVYNQGGVTIWRLR